MNKPYAPPLVSYSALAQPFDETDDDLMHDVVGIERLTGPVQDLLIAYKLIEKTDGSFGADNKKLADYLRPKLKALFEACKREWEDQ